MKSVRPFLFLGGIILASLSSSDAQQTDTAASADDVQAMLQAVESTPPLPASAAPDAGNFYSAQFGDSWPPFPANTLNLPFWSLGDGIYIMDDREVDYAELDAEAEAVALLSPEGGGLFSMTTSSLNSSYAYTNPVFLTNI